MAYLQGIVIQCAAACFFIVITFLPVLSQAFAAKTENCHQPKADSMVELAYVIDGDTLLLKNRQKVRLLGVNTPEIAHEKVSAEPFARKAKKYLRKLLSKNNKLRLVYDQKRRDKYHRLLAYVFLPDGTDIQAQLLKQGLAVSIAIWPNHLMLDCYRQIEAQARRKKLGIWQLNKYQSIEASRLGKRHFKKYVFVRGKISKVKQFSGFLILYFENSRFSVKVERQAFEGLKNRRSTAKNLSAALVGRVVAVRGYLYNFRGHPGMTIRYSQNLSL